MNSELQAQSDVLVKAITHLETTIHQDIIFACAAVCIVVIVIGIFAVIRR